MFHFDGHFVITCQIITVLDYINDPIHSQNWLIIFLNPENVGLDTKIMILDEIITEKMWLWNYTIKL